MSAQSYGQGGMIPQPLRRAYVQGRGWSWILTWIGPKADAYGLEQQLIDAGYDVNTAEVHGGKAIVEANFGGRDDIGAGSETAVDNWERQINRVEKSIFEHSKFAALTHANKRLVRKKFEKFQSLEDDPDEVTLTDTATEKPATLYDLLTKGVEVFIVEQPVVRLTQTVSSRYARSAARDNVGSVLTYAQMISLESAPIAVLDNKTVPSGLTSIASYGYRKGDPVITQAAGNKWQIVTEWEAGFWSTFLYTFVS